MPYALCLATPEERQKDNWKQCLYRSHRAEQGYKEKSAQKSKKNEEERMECFRKQAELEGERRQQAEENVGTSGGSSSSSGSSELPGLEVAEAFRGRLVLRFLVLVERAGRQAANGRNTGPVRSNSMSIIFFRSTSMVVK